VRRVASELLCIPRTGPTSLVNTAKLHGSTLEIANGIGSSVVDFPLASPLAERVEYLARAGRVDVWFALATISDAEIHKPVLLDRPR